MPRKHHKNLLFSECDTVVYLATAFHNVWLDRYLVSDLVLQCQQHVLIALTGALRSQYHARNIHSVFIKTTYIQYFQGSNFTYNVM